MFLAKFGPVPYIPALKTDNLLKTGKNNRLWKMVSFQLFTVCERAPEDVSGKVSANFVHPSSRNR